MIRKAKKTDHKRILELAKMSPHTRDYGHMMFSGDEAYKKGWIRVFDAGRGGILGFTCVRHKVRDPETSLYFIGIHSKCQRQGMGEQLLEDLKKETPHDRIILNVMKDNKQAIQFYEKHGFTCLGDSLKGKGFQLVLDWS